MQAECGQSDLVPAAAFVWSAGLLLFQVLAALQKTEWTQKRIKKNARQEVRVWLIVSVCPFLCYLSDQLHVDFICGELHIRRSS